MAKNKKIMTIHINCDSMNVNKKVRHNWGFLKPFDRIVKSKKQYSRKNLKIETEEE